MICISVLERKQFLSIGRASDLLWIKFGERAMDQKAEAGGMKRREYALDIQCPWRIKDKSNSGIILASYDIYEPNSQIEWNESFDWDVQGNNLFDEKVKKIFSSVDINVDYVSVSVNNDLTVGFSNGLILETFINVSSEIECWRFFEKGKDEHLVIYGCERKVE